MGKEHSKEYHGQRPALLEGSKVLHCKGYCNSEVIEAPKTIEETVRLVRRGEVIKLKVDLLCYGVQELALQRDQEADPWAKLRL